VTRVLVPTALGTYTAGRTEVEARGSTLGAVLADLDVQFPGLRFRIIDEQDRIRQHVRLFVDGEMATSLATPVASGQVVHILLALSGG
jgi:molybdopterin converting factor small subunit